jgi:hypothetical protein
MSLYTFARHFPLIRGLGHTAAVYHHGSVIENTLGLQVGRTLGKHLSWRLRGCKVPSELARQARVLERDGILVMPDFLPKENFTRVRAEFDAIAIRYEAYRTEGRLHVATVAIKEGDERFAAIRKALQQNATINTLANVITHRGVHEPFVSILCHRLVNPQEADNDLENILHSDLHAPTAKAFFYLSDTDTNNGAFVYARGSHKVTIARLLHEWDMSVRTVKLKSGRSVPSHLITERAGKSRNLISPETSRRMAVTASPVCVEANTLVITNTMGFHCRGEFTGDRPREVVLLNYRHVERPF